MSVNDDFHDVNDFHDCDDIINNYINLIIDKTDNSILYKKDYRTLISEINYWSYNRPLNDTVINTLYDVIISNNNNINWFLTAIKEKNNNKIYLLDGQHRCAAIQKAIEQDINMEINKFVYINIYLIDNIDNDDEYIIDLFIKINNSTPLNIPDFPSKFTTKIIKEIIKDPILTKGISTNPKTHSSHQPKIHTKTLNEILNLNNKYIKNIDINIIIQNLKIVNNKLSFMTYQDIFNKTNKNDENIWYKAKEIGFFLGFKNCNPKFKLDNIIVNINNINSLFI